MVMEHRAVFACVNIEMNPLGRETFSQGGINDRSHPREVERNKVAGSSQVDGAEKHAKPEFLASFNSYSN